MGVPHHHGDGLPSSKFLHGVDIDPGLHKTGGERMARIVKTKGFHLRFSHDRIEHAKEISRIHPIPGAVEEHVIAFERTNPSSSLQYLKRLCIDWKGILRSVLLLQQRNGPPEEINPGPLQVEDFSLSKPRLCGADSTAQCITSAPCRQRVKDLGGRLKTE